MSRRSENKSESLEKYSPRTGMVKAEPEIGTGDLGAEVREGAVARPDGRRWLRSSRKRQVRLVVLLATASIIAFLVWLSLRPKEVTVIQPRLMTITETIASSGRVGGATETLVGAQAAGIVEQLHVKEGDRVAEGQTLALLKNDVAEAQVHRPSRRSGLHGRSCHRPRAAL
ncbi:MAG: biotin/lipoyl-binding protein [Blastocatellia bacterium]|nr:biotin/lipoyl-binding protein [Blastocatellia bacterium]